jgi:hypothetical protein
MIPECPDLPRVTCGEEQSQGEGCWDRGCTKQMDKRLSRIEKRPGIRQFILESEIKGLRSEMVGKSKSLGDEVNDLRRVPNNGSPWILGVRLAI